MASYEIGNEKIRIRVNTLGAELVSLVKQDTGTEYMWSADPAYWGHTAPVLFPFVGRLQGQQYTYREQVYKPRPHGFARDMEFELLEQTTDMLRFALKDTPETKAVYPFSFRFEILYRIEEEQVTVSYRVHNTGEETMYFSLGAHPGFRCPIQEGQKRKECYIRFKDAEKLISRDVDMETGLVKDSVKEYVLQNSLLPIADDLFEQDALVLENGQVEEVSLLDKEMSPFVTLRMKAPIYGIWSSVKPGAPFICIEPWFGRCDANSFRGTLEEREYQNRLEASMLFETEFTITIA